jgi:pyridoxamine 5'-phosphate oxidase
MSDRLTSLDSIEAEVWRQLGLCVRDKDHAWRTPVLATIADDVADARTVVIREVDARNRQFLVYTDERANKVAQLLRSPRGTMVMWSQTMSWQLRCRVHLSLESTGLSASSRWARIRLSPAAQDYLSPLPPGEPIEPAPPAVPPHPPVERDFFAIIDAQVESIDWLELSADGHRRARFDGQGSRWLQP